MQGVQLSDTTCREKCGQKTYSKDERHLHLCLKSTRHNSPRVWRVGWTSVPLQTRDNVYCLAMKLFVSDVSGVKEEVDVKPETSHNEFRLVLRKLFGSCVPLARPFMASLVRDGNLVRDVCFRQDEVGDKNNITGLGSFFFMPKPVKRSNTARNICPFSSFCVSLQECKRTITCGFLLRRRHKLCLKNGSRTQKI